MEHRETALPIAVIGADAALRVKLPPRLPAGTVEWGPNVPCYRDLSIRDNVQQLKLVLPPERLPLLEALLAQSGLQGRGWNRPFPKDLPGQRQLFGLLGAMLCREPLLLAYEPLTGMTGKEREAFARLLRCYGAHGGQIVYTAPSLRDALLPEIEQEIWLSRPEGFLETDTAAIEASCAGLETPEQRSRRYREWEVGEIG